MHSELGGAQRAHDEDMQGAYVLGLSGILCVLGAGDRARVAFTIRSALVSRYPSAGDMSRSLWPQLRVP